MASELIEQFQQDAQM